jgi:hypothetical protein
MTVLRSVRAGGVPVLMAVAALALSQATPALARSAHRSDAHAARAAAQLCPAPTGSGQLAAPGTPPPSTLPPAVGDGPQLAAPGTPAPGTPSVGQGGSRC